MQRNACVLCYTNWIGPVLSLTAIMTSVGCWLLFVSAFTWESLAKSWSTLRTIDDDWTMLTLPMGMAIGFGLWMAMRRRWWLHVFAFGSLALLVLLLLHELTRVVPPGMENLGLAIGKMIVVALAYTAAFTGLAALGIASLTVLIMRLISHWKSRNAPGSFESGE
jgi:hypothetical protein